MLGVSATILGASLMVEIHYNSPEEMTKIDVAKVMDAASNRRKRWHDSASEAWWRG